MTTLDVLYELSAASHNHLCPRQVLGVRMGVYACEQLGLPFPQKDKRLFTFIETDGCFADGVATATGCTLGHRTMRLIDYGKVAATFADTETYEAIRIHPHLRSRERATEYASNERSRWHTQLKAYQLMPAEELFTVHEVELNISVREIISRPGVRVCCAICGEEIINEREQIIDGLTMCRACAGDQYYHFSFEMQHINA